MLHHKHSSIIFPETVIPFVDDPASEVSEEWVTGRALQHCMACMIESRAGFTYKRKVWRHVYKTDIQITRNYNMN